MAPIRRYLRITKRSVLEVRIYLDRPSDSPWLLSSRDPVLPRIMEEIRPKVLPKLREENENAKKKSGKKKKGIKDVVSTDDFEVVIFLKELSTRHSLLTKQKDFANKPKLRSTGNKLSGWLNDSENPIDLDEDSRAPAVLREEDDEVVELSKIPEAPATNRKANGLFVSSDEEDAFEPAPVPARKRKRPSTLEEEEQEDTQGASDKKKLALNTSFDGFSIYGRTLCLVVKRKGKKVAERHATSQLGGSQMMEQWVSTQAAREDGLDVDNG